VLIAHVLEIGALVKTITAETITIPIITAVTRSAPRPTIALKYGKIIVG
jgi:hypothetical protein